MTRPLVIAIAAIGVLLSSRLDAQQNRQQFLPVHVELLASRISPPHALGNLRTSIFRSAKDHRWEGLAVGAIALGAVGAILGNRLCADNNSAGASGCLGSTVGVGLVGATVGGVFGIFIGSAIPKRP